MDFSRLIQDNVVLIVLFIAVFVIFKAANIGPYKHVKMLIAVVLGLLSIAVATYWLTHNV